MLQPESSVEVLLEHFTVFPNIRMLWILELDASGLLNYTTTSVFG
jgi:hypothetical protein